MTIFINILINFIEAFLFPFFIANYFDFQNKKIYISITCFIQFLILNLFYFYTNSGLLLTIVIILTMLLSIFISQKHLSFNHFYITIFYNCLILIVAWLVLLIHNLFLTLNQFLMLQNIDFFLVSCLLSRMILFISTIFILKRKLNLSLSFTFKNWYFLLILESLLLIITGLILNSIMLNQFNKSILYIVLFLLILISILFIIMIYYINKTNIAKIKLEKEKQRKDFESKKLNTIQNIKNDINAIEHRMFYVFYNVEILLENQQYNQAFELLKKQRSQAFKYNTLIYTENPIFDYLINLKVNDLLSMGIDMKLCILICKSIIYDDLTFINTLNSLLDILNLASSISIHITEKYNFTIIKIHYTSQTQINHDLILEHIHNLQNTFHLKYECMHNKITFVINREIYNEF